MLPNNEEPDNVACSLPSNSGREIGRHILGFLLVEININVELCTKRMRLRQAAEENLIQKRASTLVVSDKDMGIRLKRWV